MNSHSCTRTTLSVFIRSLTNVEVGVLPRATASHCPRPLRAFSSSSPALRNDDGTPASRGYRLSSSGGDRNSRSPPTRGDRFPTSRGDRFPSSRGDQFPSSRGGRSAVPVRREPKEERITWRENTMALDTSEEPKERPHWQIQKAALKEKLNGEAWNPRKKLSPDTQEGIRHLHQTRPEQFTTAVLADHFKVSPEAIRRILKSKWKPSDQEQDERLARWDKRGEKIWSNMVELGLKPPKKWREMGVGSSTDGQAPRWKSGSRNTVPMNDSFSEDIIPIVSGNAEDSRPRKTQQIPMFDRIL